jgi:nucleotide-binding universal stress UspA family protein
MTVKTLAQRVRAYLDAESLLNIRRAGDSDVHAQEQDVGKLRQEVLDGLAEAREEQWMDFYVAVQDYLNASELFETSRAARKELDRPARVRERARRELESQLIAIQTNSPAAEPRRPASPPRVLIALDNSEQSDWALEVGTRLASKLQANVTLVHAVQPELRVTESYVTGQTLDRLHQKAGKDLLADAARRMPKNLSVQTVLSDGVPAEEIVTVARDCSADLIVLGTHARGKIARFLLGSTAEGVIRHAPCPVISVGQEPKRSLDRAAAAPAAQPKVEHVEV